MMTDNTGSKLVSIDPEAASYTEAAVIFRDNVTTPSDRQFDLTTRDVLNIAPHLEGQLEAVIISAQTRQKSSSPHYKNPKLEVHFYGKPEVYEDAQELVLKDFFQIDDVRLISDAAGLVEPGEKRPSNQAFDTLIRSAASNWLETVKQHIAEHAVAYIQPAPTARSAKDKAGPTP